MLVSAGLSSPELISPQETGDDPILGGQKTSEASVRNAKVLFVSSNPHTLRTAQDTHAVLREMGRGDITLVVAGASAPANAPIQLFLGEVGRLIDNDIKRNYGG